MPLTTRFQGDLQAVLPELIEHFGTPFHIYDERGIRETARRLLAAFADIDMREHFAVKALPNPHVLAILAEEGCGFDCSSEAELRLAAMAGAVGDDVFFTSNNTSARELRLAIDSGCMLNLDDRTLVDRLPEVPELVCFRLNPGRRRSRDAIFGDPAQTKFGLRPDQLADAVRAARDAGAHRFGLHAMLASNERDAARLCDGLAVLLDAAAALRAALGVECALINAGGGFGIPYRPDEAPLDLECLAHAMSAMLRRWAVDHDSPVPRLCLELGRFMTGPHGALVTRVINRMSKWKEYVGVDAGMSALMRPGLYEHAYHHITVLRPRTSTTEVVDVVGSLCENNDRLATDRRLPVVASGDTLIVHDTGAHGHAMGFAYNGRLRPQELLLRPDGTVERIRRAEEIQRDHFATLDCDPAALRTAWAGVAS